MRNPFRAIYRAWRRGFRPMLSGTMLGLLATWLLATFVVLPAMWPVPAGAQQKLGADQLDKLCFTTAECDPDMIKDAKCTSGNGCCTDDRCFLPGGGCPQGKEDPDKKGRCYAKSPPIDLVINIGGQTTVVDIGDYLEAAYKYGVGIVIFLAGVMIVIGGFIYLTSADSGRTQKAKSIISDSLVGVAVALGAYVLLNTINPQLLNMQLPKIPIIKSEKFVGCEYTKLCYGCGEKYGLTEEYVKMVASGQGTDSGSGTSNLCNEKFVVPDDNPSKVVSCVGGGCTCVSNGNCPDGSYKCRKVDKNNPPSNACSDSNAVAKATETGWACSSCEPNGGNCDDDGPDESCCSGFCGGKKCTGGRPGDPCGDDLTGYWVEDPGDACRSGICQTDGFNHCSTGEIGARCDNNDQCNGSLRCSGAAWRNFCTPGTTFSWCDDTKDCQSGNTCIPGGAGAFNMCIPESWQNFYLKDQLLSDGNKYNIGFNKDGWTAGSGLICFNDQDCNTINYGFGGKLKYCVNAGFSKVCTDGSMGALCDSPQHCDSGYCIFMGGSATSGVGFCGTGNLGSMCRKMQDCKSGYCNTEADGWVCVSGDLGSMCGNGGACKPGLKCQGSGKNQMCVIDKSAANSCVSK